jgi:hypothetical protein
LTPLKEIWKVLLCSITPSPKNIYTLSLSAAMEGTNATVFDLRNERLHNDVAYVERVKQRTKNA